MKTVKMILALGLSVFSIGAHAGVENLSIAVPLENFSYEKEFDSQNEATLYVENLGPDHYESLTGYWHVYKQNTKLEGDLQFACSEIIIKVNAIFTPKSGLFGGKYIKANVNRSSYCVERVLSEKQAISYYRHCLKNPDMGCNSPEVAARLDQVKPTVVTYDYSNLPCMDPSK